MSFLVKYSKLFKRPFFPFLLSGAFLLLSAAFPVDGDAIAEGLINVKRIALVLSRDNRPYNEAADSFSSEIKDSNLEIVKSINLQNYTKEETIGVLTKEAEGEGELFIAIGPEATQICYETGLPFVYTMVLEPEQIINESGTACGVSFRISIGEQLTAIKRTLPTVRNIGLLYDKEYNERIFLESLQQADGIGMSIVPLSVSSTREIPNVLNANWDKLDAIWFIPDQTIKSISIIEYIIKESLLKHIPTIGYNRSFYEFGSVMTFAFDYRELGRQTAILTMKAVENGYCRSESPGYGILVNERAAKRVNVKVMKEDGVQIGAEK